MIAVVVQLTNTHIQKQLKNKLLKPSKKTSYMINYDPEHNVKVTTVPFFLTIKVKSTELERDTRVSSKQGRRKEKRYN